jgi:sorting and assembly machinery component 37
MFELHSFSAFLESRGQPLLDLALYVCSDNYTEWTRPALAQILQWPRQWTVPHRLRDDAKIRSDHLGLSSLDIEAAGGDDGDTNARGAGNIPKSLIAKPKETVTKLLGKSGHQNQFRLDAVTSDFLEPLCGLVEKNGSDSWVFGTDKATSLDCLLLAYLSLMSPPLLPPRRWLQAALSSNYPVVLEWTTNFRQECFGGPVGAADVLAISPSNIHTAHNNLPWHPRAQISMENMVLTVLAAAFDSLPIVSGYFPVRIMRISPGNARSTGDDTDGPPTVRSNNFSLLLGGLGLAGSALGAATTFYFRQYQFSRREGAQRTHNLGRRTMSNKRDFGEAGRMLGLGSN